MNVPVAVNNTLVPWAMPSEGLMAILLRLSAVIVRGALSDCDSKLAEIVTGVVVTFLALTTPLAVTEAVCVEDELQLATLVTSCDVPSENCAVAVNCRLTNNVIEAGLGVIASDVALAAVTFNVAVAETLPEVAVIIVVPAEMPVASPFVGDVSLIVATAGFDEFQVTVPVIVCTLLSLNVPVAINCCLVDDAIVGLVGAIVIETSFGAMVKLTEPLTALMLALTETLPLACAVSVPFAATVASPAGDVAQVTDTVRSLVLLSLYLPVAVSCSLSPTVRLILGAAT